MGRADRDDQARRAVNLIASNPDGADRRAGLVHNAHRPFRFGPEIAAQFFQLFAHEHHGSIAGCRGIRKLGAGKVGLVDPVVEVEQVAGRDR